MVSPVGRQPYLQSYPVRHLGVLLRLGVSLSDIREVADMLVPFGMCSRASLLSERSYPLGSWPG